jgi:hypothetical protein
VLLKLYVNWGNVSHCWTSYVNSTAHFYSQHGCNLQGFAFVNAAWVTYFFLTDLVLILAGFIKATHADVYIHECCIACIDMHARACVHTHTHTHTHTHMPILLVVSHNTTYVHAFINVCHVNNVDSFVSVWAGSYIDVSMHAFFIGCIDECMCLV